MICIMIAGWMKTAVLKTRSGSQNTLRGIITLNEQNQMGMSDVSRSNEEMKPFYAILAV